MTLRPRLAALVGAALALTACNGEKRAPLSNTDTTAADPPHSRPQPTAAEPAPPNETQPAEPTESVTMIGKVIKRPWSKTLESWRARGSDYFVIQTDDGESTILRPSDQVTVEALEAANGKKMRVTGTKVPLKPYRPSNHMEQYPMGSDGQPEPTGGGIRVMSLEAIE